MTLTCLKFINLPFLAWSNPLSRMSPSTRQAVLIMFGLWVVSMVLVIWALFFRSRRRHHSHHSHHPRVTHTIEPGSDHPGEGEGSGSRRRRRRRRKPRSSELPLNPTLAQTGGLPPLRSEKPPGPPA